MSSPEPTTAPPASAILPPNTPWQAAVKSLWKKEGRWLAGYVGLAGLVLLLAFQVQPFTHRLDIGIVQDKTYVAGFYGPERNATFDYRWSKVRSFVNVHQVGTPYELSFRAAAVRPDAQPVLVTVFADGQRLGQVTVGSTPEVFSLRSSRLNWGAGDLALSFEVASTFVESGPGGRPDLGMALDWAQVTPYRNRLGLIVPPPLQWGWWLALASGPLLFWRVLGRQRAYIASFFNLLLITGLLALPFTAPYFRTDGLRVGLLLALAELLILSGWLWLTQRSNKSALTLPRLGAISLALLLLALACIYLASARGYLSFGDDQVMEGVTAAIAAGQPTAPLTRFLPPTDEPLRRLYGGDGGAPEYSKYGLGLSLVAVPFYWLGEGAAQSWPFMYSERNGSTGLAVYLLLLTTLVITVASVGLFYWFLRLLGFGQWASLATTSLYALGTMAWHYARTFMSEPLVAFCFLLALIASLKYRQSLQVARSGWAWAGLAGFAIGLSVATRTPNLLVVPFFGLYLLWVWWEQRSVDWRRKVLSPQGWQSLFFPALSWLAGLAGWLGLTGWYNYARFGSFTATGYDNNVEGFNNPFWTGFYGQLFSSGKSIFLYNPVLLLALVGLGLAYQRQKAIGLLTLAVTVVYVGLYSLWDFWYGGGVWGPRFLLPVVPLMLWPAAYLFESRLEKKRQRSAARIEKTQSINDEEAVQVIKSPRGRLSWPHFPSLIPHPSSLLISLVLLASGLVQWAALLVDYHIYVASLGPKRTPELFERAMYHLPDSPIVVHWKLWLNGTAPDLAPNIYQETPFARWVAVLQSSNLLLFLIFSLLAFILVIGGRAKKLYS